MKKWKLFFVVCLFLSTTGIVYADPYADEVVQYEMGLGGVYGIDLDHRNPARALGQPDYDYINHNDRYGYTSLGWGGLLVVKFTDNYLTTSGNADTDLWLYEIGDELECTEVYIRAEGGDWINVGSVPGGIAGIDIDAYIGKGVEPWKAYTYVKIKDTDVNEPHKSFSPWAGADIDAVKATSHSAPVRTPEPGLIAMLSVGCAGIAGYRCRKRNN